MAKSVYIIDFSGTEIIAGVLRDNKFEPIDVNLPWTVGFQQETDGKLAPYFGDEATKRLNPNDPEEVVFTTLDVHLKEITDEKSLTSLLDAFAAEIFRRLSARGCVIGGAAVYPITPSHWTPQHRQHLRRSLKKIEADTLANTSGETFTLPELTVRGTLNQILCLAVYYQKFVTDMLTESNELTLFMIDFARNDFTVHRTVFRHSPEKVSVELVDALRYVDYFEAPEKQVRRVQRVLNKAKQPIAVGVSGEMSSDARTVIRLLKARSNATFFEHEERATLFGAAKIVKQFEGQTWKTPLHLHYNFCFGVQFPKGKVVELIPKTWTPPFHRKKAFRVTGELDEFVVHLCCGLSLSKESDVHRLATLDIVPKTEKNYTTRSPFEFILSITLNDFSQGTWTAHLPDSEEEKSVEFTVPVLMD